MILKNKLIIDTDTLKGYLNVYDKIINKEIELEDINIFSNISFLILLEEGAIKIKYD